MAARRATRGGATSLPSRLRRRRAPVATRCALSGELHGLSRRAWRLAGAMAAPSGSSGAGAQLVVEECGGGYSLAPMADIKVEQALDGGAEEGQAQGVAMGMKFILPSRFDMNVCSRLVKSLNEEDSKNIQDQVNSDLEVASVLFKGGAAPCRLLCAGSLHPLRVLRFKAVSACVCVCVIVSTIRSATIFYTCLSNYYPKLIFPKLILFHFLIEKTAEKAFNLLKADANDKNKLTSSDSKPYYKVIQHTTHS